MPSDARCTLLQSPHLVSWMNHLKTGSAMVVFYTSVVLMVLVWHPGMSSAAELEAGSEVLTIVLLAGLVPSFLFGVLVSWMYFGHTTASALAAFK